jgi:hypothetical protein
MPALFVWLVLLMAAAKIPSEEAALLAGTKQNWSHLLFFRYLWCKQALGEDKLFLSCNKKIRQDIESHKNRLNQLGVQACR